MADADQPREFELKLEIGADAVDGLRSHPLFRTAAPPKQLTATYYDTRKHSLREAGLSFRVREGSGRFVQTLKSERRGGGIALDRGEWECDVPSAEPDLAAVRGTPLEPLVGDGSTGRKLRPLFTVAVERLVSVSRENGAEIELALDQGKVEAGDKASTFAELELELKAGEPSALYAAALSLAEAAPVRLSTRTKSARGYALAGARSVACVKAEPVVLHPGQSTAEAFQAIAGSCLRQLIDNETLIRESLNPDAIHQARVAIRRLRAAISLFKHVVADAQTETVKTELKAMADPLGQARDLDVFIAKVLRPAVKSDGSSELRKAVADYKTRRDSAYRNALEIVRSEWFARSVLDVAAWIETGAWVSGDAEGDAAGRNEPIAGFAADELGRRWRKVRRRLKGIEEVDEEQRHRIRIEIKKLRYAAEFFSALFEGSGRKKRLRECLDAVEALQGSLGDLNDIAVARAMAPELERNAVMRERDRAIEPLLAKVREQAQQFRAAQPFWASSSAA